MDYSQKKFDIVVIAGQSNAEGNGLSQDDEKLILDNAYQLYDKNDYWIDCSDPKNPVFHITLPIELELKNLQERGNKKPYQYDFGISFALRYLKGNLLEKGRDLLIIKSGVGGTGFALNQQGLGNFCYTRCLDMVDYALKLNPENRIVAYLWHQGEHDAFENAQMNEKERYDFYHEKFMEQTRDFLSRYKQFTFPVICAGFCKEWANQKENIKQTQVIEKCLQDCMNELGHASMINTDDLTSNNFELNNGDGIHFSKKSLITLGERYFDEYVRLYNQKNIKLIKLTKDYYSQLSTMIDEWKLDQQVNHTNTSPGAIFRNDYHDFDNYLANLEVKDASTGLVPDSVFFLYDELRNRLLGAVDIRHYLNEGLLATGGHIGDGIRPSERRKGYASLMIKLALLECKKLGIDKVLITCNDNNIGSRKSILNNGGVLENTVIDEDGSILERYWIDNK